MFVIVYSLLSLSYGDWHVYDDILSEQHGKSRVLSSSDNNKTFV